MGGRREESKDEAKSREEKSMLPTHNRYCSSFLADGQLGRLALRSELGEVVGETWMREGV